MRRALIGHTGFVGGNLASQIAVDDVYRSVTIEDIRGRQYDEVYCAGAPGVKWKANQQPDEDAASIGRLTSALASVRIGHLVLISTVDVYPVPRGVDEGTPIDTARLEPYGRHRLDLERFVAENFSATIVRLPALFGPGLKKNAIYDLLHDNRVHAINPASTFQFYDLTRLAQDVSTAIERSLPLVNFATEPVSVGDIARRSFGFELDNPSPPAVQAYDIRTRHDEAFGGRRGYLYDRDTTFARLADYVRSAGWVGR